MRKLHKAFYGLCASLSISGCAGVGLGGDHVRWTEEVKLSDGNVIQLQRHVELTDSGFPVQKRGFDKYHEICYPQMGIYWKSKGGYLPDIFDIVGGKAYMHVPISDCSQCMLHGHPPTDALYFVWSNGQWKQITHDKFPSASEWNLEMGVKGASSHKEDDMHGLVTLQYKDRPTSLRIDQKRFGWKRVSDSYAWKGSCDACRSRKVATDATPDIFLIDKQPNCRP